MRMIGLLSGVAAVALAGGAATVGPAPVHASEVVEWSFSMWGPPRAVTRGAEAVADYVEEQSGGNFTIEIHYGEAISPARQNLDGLKIGAFESAQICTSYHPGKNPVSTVLDLPFLPMASFRELVHVHDAFSEHELFVNEMAGWGARYLASTALPLYEFMGVGDAPRELEDWQGMRVRALGGMGEAMATIGAVPTTMPAPEVYQSLERGVVQAASFPYSYSHGAYRLHEVSDWYTEGLQPGSAFCLTLTAIDAHDALPEEYKEMLRDARPLAYDALEAAYVEADERFRPLFNEHLELIEISPEERQEFIEVAGEPVWAEWVEQYEDRFDSRAVLDFVLEKAEEAAAEYGS